MLRSLLLTSFLAFVLNVVLAQPAYAIFCFGDPGFGEEFASISTTGTANQALITARTDIYHTGGSGGHSGSCSGTVKTQAVTGSCQSSQSTGTHNSTANPKVTATVTCSGLPNYTTIYGYNNHQWDNDDEITERSEGSVYFTPPDPCQNCNGDPGCECQNCFGGTWDGSYCYQSPIMVKIVGNNANYNLSSVQAGVMFDLAAVGSPVQTAWSRAGSAVGFLVIDKNGDGEITSGAEMFGTATLLSSGTVATNGFQALEELDENGDGIVDDKDSRYRELRLWFDLNHDGQSSRSEVMTLQRAGVRAFRTQYVERDRRDRHGNWYRFEGSAETLSGDQLRIFDIFLVTAPSSRQ